ncbi:ssDNA endonuclease and repair protein rad10 [Elasticomyces elasticus]|nr:ssDNA endonuclease and repair protein rad10 [Elasticomyces elasticus]
MDDDLDDADFAALETAQSVPRPSAATPTSAQPAKVGSTTSNPGGAHGAAKVVQPKPQALPSRAGPSSILVSPRQKGNPILANIRSMPWEYSDIPADYVLGATTCALFLSLKYHRLHPEYIYSRIRALQGKYNLRILLTMVDIQNHEESLRELSKTSLINNVTIILTWSAAEAGRYLELYKSYEHAAPTSIRAQGATSLSDKLVEFITVPRSINKTDAVGLVSNFGSLRTAVNARPEEIALIAGWGEKKVQRWCQAVRQPFRVKKAAKRGVTRENTAILSRDISGEKTRPSTSRDVTRGETEGRVSNSPLFVGASPSKPTTAVGRATPDADRRSSTRIAEPDSLREPDADEEEVLANAIAPRGTTVALPQQAASRKRKPPEEDLSDGVMAALTRLRETPK